MKRQAVVRGSFYPETCAAIETMAAAWDASAPAGDGGIVPRALIVPHAGYVYSGYTASCAYRLLAGCRGLRRAVVIGPSHRVGFRGISGIPYDSYETPCRDLPIDRDYLLHVAPLGDIGYLEQAHHEHSTEVQMPLLARYGGDMAVVELVYGTCDAARLLPVIGACLDDPQTLTVISTDLSHYYTDKEARSIDRHCVEGVARMDPTLLARGEACGMIGAMALMEAAKERGMRAKVLDYRTSADAGGDETRVVGYMSAAVW